MRSRFFFVIATVFFGLFFSVLGYFPVVAKGADNAPLINLSYETHVQNIGWQDAVLSDEISGTVGKGLKLEAMRIHLETSLDLKLSYRSQIENIGWQEMKQDDEVSGTEGRNLRLEAIELSLAGEDAEKYNVFYQVHCQNYGWLNFAKNGEPAGTEGLGLQLEAIRILILPKDESTPIPLGSAFYSFINHETLDRESHLAAMSVEEKVAQLFIVAPEALTGEDKTTTPFDINVNGYPVGGIILFTRNIENPEQTLALTAAIKNQSREEISQPLFVCIDEEGGNVARLGYNNNYAIPHFDSNITTAYDREIIKNQGWSQGQYLSDYGFNVNFSPVCDVPYGPKSFIYSRSFGTNAQSVAAVIPDYISALHDYNILTAVKHFPGLGSSVGDTHQGFVEITKSISELESWDFLPFQAGIEAGSDFVMIGHISLTALSDYPLPASLSHQVITEILRKQLGYQGLVVTDALNMGAITKLYPSDEAALLSFQAGTDVLLMPADFQASYQKILTAVRDGVISPERLDESVRRILITKESL